MISQVWDDGLSSQYLRKITKEQLYLPYIVHAKDQSQAWDILQSSNNTG